MRGLRLSTESTMPGIRILGKGLPILVPLYLSNSVLEKRPWDNPIHSEYASRNYMMHLPDTP